MFLQIDAISKKFDSKAVLENASFSFEKGKIYGLLGRNGAGKTTFFNCIARNLKLDGGQIALVENGVARSYDTTEIGFTQTYPQLPTFMTAFEFIRFYMDIHKEQIIIQRSPEEWLTLVGIAPNDQHRLLKDFSHACKTRCRCCCLWWCNHLSCSWMSH